MENQTVLIVTGCPGCGKGALIEYLQQELIKHNIALPEEITYISTGDILRAAIASQSEIGRKVEQIVNSGGLVSDEIVISLVRDVLAGCKTKIIILDGYPRTQAQLDDLRQIIQKQGHYVIRIKRNTPKEVILERVFKRRVCKKCHCTHTVEDRKCPKCGGESVIRKDDANILRRIEEYEQNTACLWDKMRDIADDTFLLDGREEAARSARIVVQDISF